MWGYTAFATARFAAVSDANIAAVQYTAAPVRIVYGIAPAPFVRGINAIRSFGFIRETLRNSSANISAKGFIRETLRSTATGATIVSARGFIRETLRSSALAPVSDRRRMSLM